MGVKNDVRILVILFFFFTGCYTTKVEQDALKYTGTEFHLFEETRVLIDIQDKIIAAAVSGVIKGKELFVLSSANEELGRIWGPPILESPALSYLPFESVDNRDWAFVLSLLDEQKEEITELLIEKSELEIKLEAAEKVETRFDLFKTVKTWFLGLSIPAILGFGAAAIFIPSFLPRVLNFIATSAPWVGKLFGTIGTTVVKKIVGGVSNVKRVFKENPEKTYTGFEVDKIISQKLAEKIGRGTREDKVVRAFREDS